MTKSRSLTAICSILLAGLTLAACGDDDSGSGGGDKPAASTPSSNKPSGTPIRIGMVCTCSGPSGSANGPSDDVAKAWESWTNDNGGLNGHPVKIVIKDDGGDPARSAKAVRELVEQEKVMAIAGQNSLADAAWQKYVEKKGFPVVGGVPYNPAEFTSPVFFPSGASLLGAFYGFIDGAKKAGITKLGAFYCAEAATCAQIPALMGAIASKVVGGSALVDAQKIAATAPNFTAQCLKAKEAGVQGIFIASPPAVTTRVVEQCARQGFKPRFVGIEGTLPVALAKDAKYDGAIIAQSNLPPTNQEAQGGKDLAAALSKYAPGLTDDANWASNPTHTWAGLQLFAKAAEAGKLTPTSTPDDVKAGLYKLKDETLDGFAGPLNYVKGQPTLATCPFIETIKDGKWLSPNGAEPSCLSPDKVKALVAVAKAATS